MCLLQILEMLAFLVLVYIFTGPVFTVIFVMLLILMAVGIIVYGFKTSKLSEVQMRNIKTNLIVSGGIAIFIAIYFIVIFSLDSKREKERKIDKIETNSFGAKIDLVSLYLKEPSLMDSTSLARLSEQELEEFKYKVIVGKVKYGMDSDKLIYGGDTVLLDLFENYHNEGFVPRGKLDGLIINGRFYGVRMDYKTCWLGSEEEDYYSKQLMDLVTRLSKQYGDVMVVEDSDSIYRSKWLHKGEQVVLDVEKEKDMYFAAELYIYLPHTFRKVYENEDKTSPIYSYR